MGLLNRLFSWAAAEVQKTTGETARRNSVARLKELAQEFREKVSAAIDQLNKKIEEFNHSILNLNKIRSVHLKENNEILCAFLSKFGTCKPMGEYVAESERIPEKFPEQELIKIEDYIGDVDWSSDEVFWDTFLQTPIGMKIKTRKQNLSMQEHMNELVIQTDATVKELESKKFTTELEKDIADLYISNVLFISRIISSKIVPELEMVEAFLQAEKVKDQIICNHELQNVHFSYRVQSLINTPYHRHYQFIKNTFAFYIISCKIYNTPVLTNLLSNRVTEEDQVRIKAERALLSEHADRLDNSMLVQRGG